MSNVNRRNYYRLLHVQPDAPTEVIKASYRTIMQKLRQHPDLGGDTENASLLNEAYTTLCDAKKRAIYDSQLKPFKKSRGSHSSPQTPPKKKTAPSYQHYGPAHCPYCQVGSPGRTPGATPLSFCRVCDSSLTPIKETIRNSNSQRAVKRTAVAGKLNFISRWPQPTMETGKILDLSPRGLKFAYKNQLRVNSLIKIDSQGLKAVGRIVSCLGTSKQKGLAYTIGVEFITLNFQKKRDVEFS